MLEPGRPLSHPYKFQVDIFMLTKYLPGGLQGQNGGKCEIGKFSFLCGTDLLVAFRLISPRGCPGRFLDRSALRAPAIPLSFIANHSPVTRSCTHSIFPRSPHRPHIANLLLDSASQSPEQCVVAYSSHSFANVARHTRRDLR
jgi:hypothetical protein